MQEADLALPQEITAHCEVRVRIDSTTVSADVATIFECPLCSDYIMPPILQCQNGLLL
jgi:hypothetical protein